MNINISIPSTLDPKDAVTDVFAASKTYLAKAAASNDTDEVMRWTKRAIDLRILGDALHVAVNPDSPLAQEMRNRNVKVTEDNALPMPAVGGGEGLDLMVAPEPVKASKGRQRRSSKATGKAKAKSNGGSLVAPDLTDTSVAPASGKSGDRASYSADEAAAFALRWQEKGYTHAAVLTQGEDHARLVFFKGEPKDAVTLRRQPASGQKTGNSIGTFAVEEAVAITAADVADLVGHDHLTVNVAV